MQNLKYDINEVNYKTETDSKTQRIDIWLPRGQGVRGMDWEFGVSRYKLLYIEWMNDTVLWYSTRNYIQYPGISHDGKEYKNV